MHEIRSHLVTHNYVPEARRGAGMNGRRRKMRVGRAQPDGITDSGSHALADSRLFAIAHGDADAGADRRPNARSHTEVR